MVSLVLVNHLVVRLESVNRTADLQTNFALDLSGHSLIGHVFVVARPFVRGRQDLDGLRFGN